MKSKEKLPDSYDAIIKGERCRIVPPRMTWNALHELLKEVESGLGTERVMDALWSEAFEAQRDSGVASDGSTFSDWKVIK